MEQALIADLDRLGSPGPRTEPGPSNSPTRVYAVAGLVYGDEGKGTTVDFLCRHHKAQLVVRFGSGPQAAHHVVLPGGKWHCFSQFGAGMLSVRV